MLGFTAKLPPSLHISFPRKAGSLLLPGSSPSEVGRACDTSRFAFLVGLLTLTLCAHKGELSRSLKRSCGQQSLKMSGNWDDY